MLIKWGSIVVEGSGKLGGHVFYKGKGDAVIRTLARARNPQTRSQQTVKSRFTKLTQDWSNLTDDQRQSWNEATSSFSRKNRFGDVVLLTGKNLYNSLNQQLLITGQPLLDFAPVPRRQASNILNFITYDVSDAFLQLRGVFTDNAKYVVVATPKVSSGTTNVKALLRIIGVSAGSNDGDRVDDPVGLGNAYRDMFGNLAVGDTAYGGCYTVNSSGQKSTLALVRMNVRA